MSVSVNPRDVVFKFENSCNCCSSCFCIRSKPPIEVVYINSKAEVERFDSTKGMDAKKYLARSNSNLNLALTKKVERFDGSVCGLESKISGIRDDIMMRGVLTKNHMEQINTALMAYLEEQKSTNL